MEAIDISPYLKAKSDQLNSDDLLGGSITVQITRVRAPGGDQPVVIEVSGGHQPFKPCKTMRRLLVAAWGTANAAEWVGRWMTLHRDADVKWAGEAIGGIRITHLSHIDKARTYQLTETKGKKKPWRVEPLRNPSQQGASTATLDAALPDLELTIEDVDRWRASENKPPVGELTDDQRAKLAVYLTTHPETVNAIRALIPAADEVP